MKIAISSTGSTLESEVDPRFGRCQYFIVVDPETMVFEAVNNTSAAAASGAGISAAKVITDKKVRAVLTGNCGPNAFEVLSSVGTDVITGVSGKIKDVIEGYQSGQYQASVQASVPGHSGMGSMAGGRGHGRTWGISTIPGTTSLGYREPEPEDIEQKLQTLKVQSQSMAAQLAEIKRRIGELEAERK
jgi:predicted Fe-Mo cluster-binding NifX family protein